MKLPSVIRFANPKIKDAFYSLKKGDFSEQELYKTINHVLDALEKNAFSGIQIPKKLIPKVYADQYGVKNLWKYNLTQGWRLIYAVQSDEIIVVSLILEWLDHKTYEKRFKY